MVFGIKPLLQWCKLLHVRLVGNNPRRKLLIRRLAFGVLLVVATLSVFYTRAGAPTRVYAATSSTLNFQARLMNDAGAIVTDGTYSVAFNLYADASAGASEWNETQSVQVKSGYLSVYLGRDNPFPATIDWSQEQWLTMNVNGDGEMNPRLKLTAVPYAFRAKQADVLTITGGTITGDSLAQLAPAALQQVNSTVAGLRIDQRGTGGLLELAANGIDVFTVDGGGTGNFAGNLTVSGGTLDVGTNTQSGLLVLHDGSGGSSGLQASTGGLNLTSSGNVSIGANDATGTLFVLDTKNTNGDPVTAANGSMYYNSVSGKFRCYQGGVWMDCINSVSYNSTASFVSGLANVTGTVTGAVVEPLVFTSATGVSNTASVTGYTAPASGSFRTCLIKNNAAITAGTLNLRWRVNGVSVGATACPMNATNNRQSATALDPGVVTFNAGDTIGIAFDAVGMTPSGTNDFTVYWTVEYNSPLTGSGGGGGSGTLQSVYGNSTPAAITLDGTHGPLTLLDNGTTPLAGNLFQIQDSTGSTTYFGVSATGITLNGATSVTGTNSFTVGTGTTTLGGALVAAGPTNLNGNTFVGNAATDRLTVTSQILGQDALVFQGATDDANTTAFRITDPTGSNTITFPDASGVVAVSASGNIGLSATGNITFTGTLPIGSGGTGTTTAPTSGQLLIGNSSGGYSLATLSNGGGLTITPGSGTLGLAVSYGALANTAVQGNTALTCSAGSGNLTGGGDVITLGAGGACGALSIIDNPTFTTSVTSPLFTNTGNLGVTADTGTLTLSTTTSGDIVFNSAGIVRTNNTFVVGGTATRDGALADVNGTLRSNRYILGTGPDLSMIPVANGQSVVSSWWGLQLVGNRQANVDYTPGNYGAAGAYGVIVPVQQSGSVGLMIRGANGQSNDLIQFQNNNGDIEAAFSSGGNQLTLGNATATGTSAGVLRLADGGTTGAFGTIQLAGTIGTSQTYQLPTTGGVLCTTATCGSGGSYIDNQNSAAQSSSNFWISGTGRADGGFIVNQASDASDLTMTNTAITGGSLVNLTQSTSAFSGTGLLFNFAAGSGGFTGNFLDFQTNGASRFRVDSTGGLITNSTSTLALDINDTNGLNFLTINTASAVGLVNIGSATTDAKAILLVLDSYNGGSDPAGPNGSQYYGTNSNTMRCNEGIRGWTDCIGISKPNTRRTTNFAATGTTTTLTGYGDVMTQSASATAAVAATTTAPGMIQYRTSATTNNVASVSGNANYNSSASPSYQSLVMIPTAGNLASIRVWAGLTSQTAAVMGASGNPAGSHAAFRYDTSLGDSAWMCVTKDGTTQHAPVSSGITPALGTSYEMEIVVVPGSAVQFKINGAVVCGGSFTTNLPAANTMLRASNSITTLSAAIRYLQVGWIYVDSDR